MRLGSTREFGVHSGSSMTAAPRPAARDQRPRRGRERFWVLERLLDRPRHVRCCRCATAAASLLFSVVAVPSSPFEAKGEEGTSNVGAGGSVIGVRGSKLPANTLEESWMRRVCRCFP